MKKIIICSIILLSTFVINAQNCSPVLIYNFQNNLSNSGTQGAALDASNVTNITYTIGKDGTPNSAATFNGTGSKFDIPNTLDFGLRTWTLWVNASLIDNEYRVIFDADNPDLANSQTEVVVGKGADGIDYLNYGIGTNRTKSKINPNEWNHIALVKEKTAVKLYFNGCLVFTGTDMSNNHALYDGERGKIVVGKNRNDICQPRSTGSNGNCFKGSLDDLRVYDCALDINAIEDIAGKSCRNEPKFTSTCCPPWNKEVLSSWLTPTFIGTGLNSSYKLKFASNQTDLDRLNAYAKYLNMICPNKKLVITLEVGKVAAQGQPIANRAICTSWMIFNNTIQAPFNIFLGDWCHPAQTPLPSTLLPNQWYAIQSIIDTDPGPACFGNDCKVANLWVRMSSTMSRVASGTNVDTKPVLEISDGTKIISKQEFQQ